MTFNSGTKKAYCQPDAHKPPAFLHLLLLLTLNKDEFREYPDAHLLEQWNNGSQKVIYQDWHMFQSLFKNTLLLCIRNATLKDASYC